MPRLQIHHATSTTPTHSPRQTTSTVNDVVNALQRKLTANHLDPLSTQTPRRPSFSMDSLLHHKKDKKHEEVKDRDPRGQKRMSLTMRHPSKSKDRSSGPAPRVLPAEPGRFEMIIESPPLVLYGNVSNSTGALLSGRLKLLVEDATGELRLQDFTMLLRATIATKKPVGKDCKECSERTDELKKWTFLSEPKTFYEEEDHQFPYSFLFPGHLPASTQSQLGSIQYSLVASATTSHGERIILTHPLTIQRAIQPGPDKSSIRIFPPTNLAGRVQLPPIVHPIGTFPVAMSLSGVVEKKAESQTRWRLRKLSWRVEEHSKVISTPCPKHAHKVSEGKSILHSETRMLGNDEMKSGWKTDFDTVGGEITVEFEASVATKSNHKATCDVESPAGIEVKHNLVIELIVAEEFCPNRNTQLITPTGAARVLRMQFGLLVTERAGMGISWDEEMPPVYEDVPASPPGYGSADKNDGAWGGAIMEDYHGPELEYEDLESMANRDSNDPPSYRNASLPMHDRPQNRRYSSGEGPSRISPHRRQLEGWTNDELGAEPPQYGLRPRRDSVRSQTSPVEDYHEGATLNAQL
ncbi:protein LDB19 [Rhinocladiella mackenziei CBS 650.93]|uniref:Protein LDB19 n=1 Tax=Rhinocladiella mackenziei CBS 650.93 TaxID=1442369 RepID=A0A0D2HDF9_9EURO|nr:protein LDB19 [Rhinocladiella mackenziei CBS 650.93]KIX08533.1 protein LDB19 [Rhinocladiella mackenziei CBS 650.93]